MYRICLSNVPTKGNPSHRWVESWHPSFHPILRRGRQRGSRKDNPAAEWVTKNPADASLRRREDTMYDKGENSQNSRLVPMFRSKQVVDRLDRVESFDRHLYEDRIPVAHRAVPQSGQLKCLELTPILTLLRD